LEPLRTGQEFVVSARYGFLACVQAVPARQLKGFSQDGIEMRVLRNPAVVFAIRARPRG